VSQPSERTAEVAWTVAKIIDWTTGHLKKHGSESPRLEAEILLAHARNCPRIQLYVHYNELLSEGERALMRDLVRRRAQAEPVAYLVGHREFFGLDFHVTPDVLVPRPETETLVLELITVAKSLNRSAILDVGTGSGCIAIAAAVNLSGARVTATDISPAALAIARENAARHGVSDRIGFLQSDLLAGLAGDSQFDVIASNPPYVADNEIEKLPPDVRLHEPLSALRAGPKGLDVISRLIPAAVPHLGASGLLLIEIAPEQAGAVSELIAATGAFQPPRLLKDAAGDDRVIVTRRA
jgi:release factor glutamine methyltransferase